MVMGFFFDSVLEFLCFDDQVAEFLLQHLDSDVILVNNVLLILILFQEIVDSLIGYFLIAM